MGEPTLTESPADERILDATLRVLAREGVAGVSMRAVAREAEVAVGLANYYFDDKTSLICAALRRIGDKDTEMVTPRPDLSPAEQLRHALRHAVDPGFLTPDYLSLRLQLWSLAGVDPRFAEINQAGQRRYLSGLADLLGHARPDLDRSEIEQRAADILIVQNGVWLTAILINDDAAIQRSLRQCEHIAFDT